MVKWFFKKLKNSWSTTPLDAKNTRQSSHCQPPILVGKHLQRVTEDDLSPLEDEGGTYVIPEDPDHPVDQEKQREQHQYPWRFPDGDDSDTCCSDDDDSYNIPRRAKSVHGVAGIGAHGRATTRTKSLHKRGPSTPAAGRARPISADPRGAIRHTRRHTNASTPNAWNPISNQSIVLSRELMTMMMGSFGLHPMLTTFPGRVPMYFDVRRDLREARKLLNPIPGIQSCEAMDGNESAVLPKVAYMKLIFRTSHEVKEISNPTGVTCMQVLGAISQWAKSNASKEFFESLEHPYQQSIVSTFQENRGGSTPREGDGLKQYDLLLSCVYFGGLSQDSELVRERFGWNDPTVFVATFEDREVAVASGITLETQVACAPHTPHTSLQVPWQPMGN